MQFHLANSVDLIIVLHFLNFVLSSKEKLNIYKYIEDRLYSGKTCEVYNELKSVYGVDDKIARFILRDILLLNDDIRIDQTNAEYFISIDIWVRNNAQKLGIGVDDKEIRKNIIKKCNETNKNISKVAAGLWFSKDERIA